MSSDILFDSFVCVVNILHSFRNSFRYIIWHFCLICFDIFLLTFFLRYFVADQVRRFRDPALPNPIWRYQLRSAPARYISAFFVVFCHVFWHSFWFCFDIWFVFFLDNFFNISFWHSFRHSFRYIIWHFFLICFDFFLLTFFLRYFVADEVRRCPVQSGAASWGPPLPITIVNSIL